MKSRDALKTLGMLGVAFGLTTTPLAFADFHDGAPSALALARAFSWPAAHSSSSSRR